jgi:diguanylate cyclase (GGDEF)-like protein
MEELNQQDPQYVNRLRSEIDSVQSRFFHLLSITSGVMLVLAGGFVLRLFPRLLWNFESLEAERYYIPQLLCGLFCLVALLCWYVLQQRRSLKNTQKQLITELIRRETAERLAVIDPLTEMYNRRYMMRAIGSETARVDRQNSIFAFLMVDINGFKQANDALGHLVGDRILRELSLLLRKTFRTSDIISRFGGDEFLVLLVDADQEMADRAVSRLQIAIKEWNRERLIEGYEMSVSCGSALYQKGADAIAVLTAADQAMYKNKSEYSNGPQPGKAAAAAL